MLTYGTMVYVAQAAADETGLDAEIIDLRSLWPLDLETIVASVKKTGRCVIAHEATRTCGFGAELMSLVQEHCFHHLEAPIERVTGWDTPYPHAQEWAYFPGPARRRGIQACDGGLNGYPCDQDAGHREGIAEVELVEWHVQVGDSVNEDQVLAEVMTDKATVEIPSPVAGRILALGGQPGQVMAVGGELIRLEVEGAGNLAESPAAATPAAPVAAAPEEPRRPRSRRRKPPPKRRAPCATARRHGSGASLANARWPPRGAPARPRPGHRVAVRAGQRSRRTRPPRGPRCLPDPGRQRRAQHGGAAQEYAERHDEQAVPVIGLRRKIAQKMQDAKRRIPHFSYVEEIDVTDLEALRAHLNQKWGGQRGKLTLLPFLVRAMVVALRDFRS